MMNTDHGSDTTSTGKTSKKGGWARIIDYIGRQANGRRAKQQQELPADKAARRTALATWWIAAFTCALVVVSYLQWHELQATGAQTDRLIILYRKQVAQLQRQASDTHDLALAAKTQAEQAEAQTAKMAESLSKTDSLIRETRRSADAAKGAAESAITNLRPWIRIVNLQTLGNNDLIPALSYQGFGHGVFPFAAYRTVTLQTRLQIKNVGHSVAEISPAYELYLPLWGDGGKFADKVLAEQRLFCERRRDNNWDPPTKILFPDESAELGGAVQALVTPAGIDHLREANSSNPYPPIIKTNPNGYILPTVIVCVNYRISGSTHKNYQTQALFTVIKKDDRSRFFDVGVDVKERDIEILRDLGDRAN